MTKFGIINYNNNCYLNVIIQLFLSNKHTSNIIAHYLDFKKNESIDNNTKVKIICPKKLLVILSKKMNICNQNDSQEAFIHILDLIPNLEKHYQTKIKNSFKCLECNNIRKTYDTFTTFYMYESSIEESVKQMIKNDRFELECEYCKKNTDTIKNCHIKKLGDILVFYNVLKQTINYTEFISYGDIKYKLTGIIKHYGSQTSGHYIYIDYLNKYIYDDTTVSKLDRFDDRFNNIYLLFYTI